MSQRVLSEAGWFRWGKRKLGVAKSFLSVLLSRFLPRIRWLEGSCYRTVSFHVFLFGEDLAVNSLPEHCEESRTPVANFPLLFSAATIAPIRPLRTQSGEGSFFPPQTPLILFDFSAFLAAWLKGKRTKRNETNDNLKLLSMSTHFGVKLL